MTPQEKMDGHFNIGFWYIDDINSTVQCLTVFKQISNVLYLFLYYDVILYGENSIQILQEKDLYMGNQYIDIIGKRTLYGKMYIDIILNMGK